MGKMGRFGVLMSFTAFAVGFWQGLSVVRQTLTRQPAAISIDSQARVVHAKELFGNTYQNSIVRRAELVTGVEEFILARVSQGLPKAWTGYAPQITRTIITEANESGLDPIFILSVITRESRLKPAAIGGAGEIGLMQLKPDTAAWIAKKADLKWEGDASLFDPCQNIRLGVAYMKMLRARYDKHSLYYISAYNMGPKKLNQLVKEDIEPKEYAGKVMQIYTGYYKELVHEHMQRTQSLAQYRFEAPL